MSGRIMTGERDTGKCRAGSFALPGLGPADHRRRPGAATQQRESDSGGGDQGCGGGVPALGRGDPGREWGDPRCGRGDLERRRRAWTKGEDRALRRLWAEGVPASGIADRLGRTRGAVMSRARTLGLGLGTSLWGGLRSVRCTAGERTQRVCLHCGQRFASAHKGNRICCACKEDEDWSGDPDFSQRRIPRRRHEVIDG